MAWEGERASVLERISVLERTGATQSERTRGLDSRLDYITERVDGIHEKLNGLTERQYSQPSWLMAGIFAVVAALMSGLVVYALT